MVFILSHIDDFTFITRARKHHLKSHLVFNAREKVSATQHYFSLCKIYILYFSLCKIYILYFSLCKIYIL